MNVTNNVTDKDSLHQHMQQLGSRLNEVFKTFHSFENKYLYGGMIAVIAILNTDLIFLNEIKSKSPLIISSVLLACLVSAIYFWRVYERLCSHHHYFRSIKYHYELTYYAILLEAEPVDYLSWLERSLKCEEEAKKIEFPKEMSFSKIAEYLYNHHRRQLKNKKWIKNYILLPLLLVAIVMIMKVVIYAA